MFKFNPNDINSLQITVTHSSQSVEVIYNDGSKRIYNNKAAPVNETRDMRINLLVLFKDKDKAKAKGAKWDPGRKTWYIENVEDLEPFLEWVPKHLLKPYRALNTL
jgi:hypothetical protein